MQHTQTHTNTRGFTQVRGPRAKVTPLLLPVSLLSGVSQVTMCSVSCFTHTENLSLWKNNGASSLRKKNTKGEKISQDAILLPGDGDTSFIG